ncbi:MAG: hypothetical protein HQK66_13330, partial [Desulfamplus sp.]|nr:hypothetical protein [Desulfamplus sp.]
MGLFDFFIKKRYRRINKRIVLKTIFQFEYDNKIYTGVINNISLSGFGFSVSRKIEANREIDADIMIQYKDYDNNIKELNIKEKAVIKWVAHNRTLQLVDYDVGCEFVSPGKAD